MNEIAEKKSKLVEFLRKFDENKIKECDINEIYA